MEAQIGKTVTIGYVPATFPRDPIEVNFVEEHTVLGQILEPLLDSDASGALTSGLAKTWTFSKDGKSIILNLSSDHRFSDGRPLEAEDVVYTIQRHLTSKNSQSFQFLSGLKTITAVDKSTVAISLTNPDPSILKALTREQLGIVPRNWVFDRRSLEPIVGSGPYRAIKEGKDWFLVRNEKYQGSLPAKIERFKLIFYVDLNFSIPTDIIPDVIPDLSEKVLLELKSNSKFNLSDYTIVPRLSFTQTSFWIYPTSPFFVDYKKRKALAAALNSAVVSFAEKNHFAAATGMVPRGVQGHLKERISIPRPLEKSAGVHKLHLSYLPSGFSSFVQDSRVNQILKEHGFELVLSEFTPLTLSKLSAQNPDVVTGSWAGGFNDPIGFLGLLNHLLNMPFSEYLRRFDLDIDSASRELDWSKRAENFRTLSKQIITLGLNVPGWSIRTYYCAKIGFRESSPEIRYTPRFSNLYSE